MKKEGNPLAYLFGMVWRFSKGNRKDIVVYWIMFIIANVSVLILHPFIMAKLMNSVQQDGVTAQNIRYLYVILGLSVLSTVLFWSFHGPARIKERRNALQAGVNYQEFLLRGVIWLPLDWHAEHQSGNTFDKVEKGEDALYSFAATTFKSIMFGARYLLSFGVLAYFSPMSGVVVFVMTIIVMLTVMRFDKDIIVNLKEVARMENLISAKVFDMVTNISTIVVLRRQQEFFEKIKGTLRIHHETIFRNNKIIEWKWFSISFLYAVMFSVVLAVYFTQHLNTPVLVGSVFLLVRYLEELKQIFDSFADMYSNILTYRAKVSNAEELSKDFREARRTNHVLPKQWRTIDVQNLNFTYNGSNNDVLHLDDVRLSIKRGENIALVGPSGSSKTTILKLLCDLHHPQRVNLEVDGKKVAEGFPGIREDVILVQQRPEIFSGTIRDNITLGAEVDDATIRRFVKIACFDDVVDRLPKGLESVVNEKGVNLSGGEAQRLALVRGLVACRGKSVILLDETTASVDLLNEDRIFENIFDEFKGVAIISAIQKLRLLPLFDRIYMFERGRVVASGTLNELLSTCPLFQELWRKTPGNGH